MTQINTIASQHEVDPQAVVEMARSTVAHLVRMYEGDTSRLIADLHGEHSVLIVQAGIASHMQATRHMATKAMTHPAEFAQFMAGFLTDPNVAACLEARAA